MNEYTKRGDALTPREREAIGLLCEGLSNKQIADRMHCALSTVKHHLHACRIKRNVHNRIALVVKALQDGTAKFPA